jgi:hypothetical protein
VADVAHDPNDGSILVELDRTALAFGPLDQVNNTPFIPQKIMDVFDLPDEVVIVIEGQSNHCGLRYLAAFFLSNGGTGQYLGRACNDRYDFSVAADTIQATQVATSDPDIYYIANSRILGPIRQSVLNEPTVALQTALSSSTVPGASKPFTEPPPATTSPGRATGNLSASQVVEIIKVVRQIYATWKIYKNEGILAVARYWVALVSVEVAVYTFCHSPTLQSAVDQFSPELTAALREVLGCPGQAASKSMGDDGDSLQDCAAAL